MNKYLVKEIKNKKVWEGFLLKRKVESFLQSWNWGETNRLAGSKILRLGFWFDGKLVGVCLLIKEIAKRGTYFYISGGPILNWHNKNLVEFVLKTLIKVAREEKAWFIRMRPEILDTSENRQLFQKMGFMFSPMHLHAENTWLVDIRGSDEEILRRMRKTTRYLIRRSLSEGYVFEVMNSEKGVNVLYKLQMETVGRHNFVPFPKRLFLSELDSFVGDRQADLYVVKRRQRILVATLVIFYRGIAYYHFSGSSCDSVRTNASYFMQWNIIQEAKKRGCVFYNMWGISPKDVDKHRFQGVTVFKTGFGGERIDWLHARDLPISKKYWLTYLFEMSRKKIRGL